MDIQIQKAVEADIPTIVALMREFAEYENLVEFCEVTEERLVAAMFAADGFVEGLIAEENSRPIGYALFYPYFASFRGQRGYYLEDIFVTEAGRRNGVGEAMLREIAKAGRKRGFERIDFQVLAWNTPAVNFYQKLGAIRDEDERHFKFTDEAFKSLAA
jgi:GNAT superfamily N-acetyltransferase